MKELSRDSFISFLYSERNRLFSQHSFAGWNVWAIVGALFGILWLIIDLIADKTFQTTPLIGISVALLIAGYSLFKALWASVTHRHIPLRNRYRNAKLNLTDSIYILTTYLIVDFLLIRYGFYKSSHVSVIAFCAFTIIQATRSFSHLHSQKKGKLLSINVNADPEGVFEKIFSFLLFSFKVYLIFDLSHMFLSDFQTYIREIKLATYIITAYYLIATLIFVCGKSKLLRRIDVIVDKFVYGNLLQQHAFEQLTICQYGLSLGQALQSDLDKYLKDQSELDKYVEQFNLICSRFENDCPAELTERIEFIEETWQKLHQGFDIVKEQVKSNKFFLEKITNIPRPIPKEEWIIFDNLMEIVGKGIKKADHTLEAAGEFMSKINAEMTKMRSDVNTKIARRTNRVSEIDKNLANHNSPN